MIGLGSIDSALLCALFAILRVVGGASDVAELASHSTFSGSAHQEFSTSNQNPGAQSNKWDIPCEQMK